MPSASGAQRGKGGGGGGGRLALSGAAVIAAQAGPLGLPVLIGVAFAVVGRFVNPVRRGAQRVAHGLVAVPWTMLALAPVQPHTLVAVRVSVGALAAVLSAQWGAAMAQAGGFLPLVVATLRGGPTSARGWLTGESALEAYHLAIGFWEARDAAGHGFSRLEAAPLLLLTKLFGPLGLASYVVLREGRGAGAGAAGAAAAQDGSVGGARDDRRLPHTPHASAAAAAAAASDRDDDDTAAAASLAQLRAMLARDQAPGGHGLRSSSSSARAHAAHLASSRAPSLGGDNIAGVRKDLADLTELAAARAERDTVEQRLTELSIRFAEAEEDRQLLETQLMAIETEHASKVAELQAALSAAHKKAASSEGSHSAALSDLARRLATTSAAAQRLTEEKEQAVKVAQYNADRQVDEMREQNAALHVAVAAAQERAAELSREKAQLTDELAAANKQLSEAQDVLKRAQVVAAEAAAVASAAAAGGDTPNSVVSSPIAAAGGSEGLLMSILFGSGASAATAAGKERFC